MACCKCFLIDLPCFRDYSNLKIHGGITTETIKRQLILAHEKNLIPLLGEACYDELCTAKEAETLTPEQTELIRDYITPYIAFNVEFIYLNSNVHYTAAGAILHEGDGYNQPSSTDKQNAAEMARDNMSFYKKKLEQYLIDNKETFTCYEVDECKITCADDEVGYFQDLDMMPSNKKSSTNKGGYYDIY